MRRIGLAVVLALGIALAPLVAEAQEISKSARVGFLSPGIISPAQVRESPYVRAFRDGLAQLGYREGQNLVLEVRSAERQTDLGGPAQELVQLNIDVIVAAGVSSVRSAKSATQTIPIVGVFGGDPVAMGLAQSISRPGGNLTGFLQGGLETGKMLQLLSEALPELTRAGLVWNPDNPAYRGILDRSTAAASARGLSLRPIPATNLEELDAAFASLAAEKIRAVVVNGDPVWIIHSKRAAEIGLRHRIAAMWGALEIAQAGGLMAYAPDFVAQYRLAAGYVKKILDGAKPGDLPLQYQNQWMLAVNLKTAKAIGVTLSPATLARADQVIE